MHTHIYINKKRTLDLVGRQKSYRPERYIDRGSVTRHLDGYREEHLVGEENALTLNFL